MAIADDLTKTDVSQERNMLVAVGLAEDGATLYAWAEVSDDDGATKSGMGGVATRARIAAADDVTPSVQILETGEIVATIVSSGAVVTYLSADWGRTWAAV